MVSKIVPIPPFDCIVFGGAGDLAERKLFPALYHRQCTGQFSEPTRIIGTSRTEMTDDEYRKFVRNAIEKHVESDDIDKEQLDRFLKRVCYVSVDATTDKGWANLKKAINKEPAEIRAFYMAVSPTLFGNIAERLNKNGLVTELTRIIVEKPIGRDRETARKLNDTLAHVFNEGQIFRIDHYLGKEAVQNLMALRFANALYEPLWNSNHIDHVQITVAETVGVEGRGDYYDNAGALRDMVQNHLLQLLCLVAMEPPSDNTANVVRDEKLKVLHSLGCIDARNVMTRTVRGQYLAGASIEGPVGSYLDDLKKDNSNTETFVALKVDVNNWRWAGTPFYLRTGKRMTARMSEIVVTFKHIPHNIFGEEAGEILADRLVIRLQPDEGVKQWLMIKDPGPGGMRLRHIPLDMTFADSFEVRNPDAYERLLMDAVRGNQTLFMRRDEVDAAWAFVDPIEEGWEATKLPIQGYTAGTWGPSKSIALIERDGRTWNDTV